MPSSKGKKFSLLKWCFILIPPSLAGVFIVYTYYNYRKENIALFIAVMIVFLVSVMSSLSASLANRSPFPKNKKSEETLRK